MTNTINIKKVKVSNMTSSNGNKIANQFIIETEGGLYFQSYNSIIAYKPFAHGLKTILDKDYWKYNTTTDKYRDLFLNEDRKETERKIESGQYVLGTLN